MILYPIYCFVFAYYHWNRELGGTLKEKKILTFKKEKRQIFPNLFVPVLSYYTSGFQGVSLCQKYQDALGSPPPTISQTTNVSPSVIWYHRPANAVHLSSRPEIFFIIGSANTAHWGKSQPQLSGASIWVPFFESLKHAKQDLSFIEFENQV